MIDDPSKEDLFETANGFGRFIPREEIREMTSAEMDIFWDAYITERRDGESVETAVENALYFVKSME